MLSSLIIQLASWGEERRKNVVVIVVEVVQKWGSVSLLAEPMVRCCREAVSQYHCTLVLKWHGDGTHTHRVKRWRRRSRTLAESLFFLSSFLFLLLTFLLLFLFFFAFLSLADWSCLIYFLVYFPRVCILEPCCCSFCCYWIFVQAYFRKMWKTSKNGSHCNSEK